MQTVKRILKKCAGTKTDPLLVLIEWRNTPSEATGTSPAQKLFGRRCLTPLLVCNKLLKQAYFEEKLAKDKLKQKKCCDRRTKPLVELEEGRTVVLQVPGSARWVPGTIATVLPHRSYLVLSDGRTYKRNGRHIRKSRFTPPTLTPSLIL